MLRDILSDKSLSADLRSRLIAVERKHTEECVEKLMERPQLAPKKKVASTNWIRGKNSGRAVMLTEPEALAIAKKQQEEKEAKQKKRKKKSEGSEEKGDEKRAKKADQVQTKRGKKAATESAPTSAAKTPEPSQPPAKRQRNKAASSTNPAPNVPSPALIPPSPSSATRLVLLNFQGQQVLVQTNALSQQ